VYVSKLGRQQATAVIGCTALMLASNAVLRGGQGCVTPRGPKATL